MTKADSLTKIKELLEIVIHKVDFLETVRVGQSSTIHLIKDHLLVMNKKLDDLTGKVDKIENKLDDPETGLKRIYNQAEASIVSLVSIEKTLGSYKESYQINKHNIQRLDSRLRVAYRIISIDNG